MPIAAAGIAVIIGSTAFATPSVPTVFDSVTGLTWGMPFSVSVVSGTNYTSKLAEITTAGYIGASQNDVITMYNNLFAPLGATAFSTFLSTFGFSTSSISVAFTTTVDPFDPTANIIVGNLQPIADCLPTTGCSGKREGTPAIGFMYYTTATPTPEPSLLGLLVPSLIAIGYGARRRFNKD